MPSLSRLVTFCLALVLLSEALIAAAATFDAPIEIGLQRRQLRGQEVDRRKRVIQLDPSTLPLGGGPESTGLYFTEITIANLTYRVAVDTGSSYLYLAMPTCKVLGSSNACPVIGRYYDYTKSPSSSFRDCDNGLSNSPCTKCTMFDGANRCELYTKYGDQSEAFAYAVLDEFLLGDASLSVRAHFGMMYQTAGPFATDQTDGLWGIGPEKLGNMPTVFDSLVSAGLPNIYSICMNSEGGALVFGGIKTEYQVGTPQYAPMLNTLHYTVRISGLNVAGSSAGIPDTTALVDTGTTLFLLPESQFSSLKSTMQQGRCNLPGMGCSSSENIFDPTLCWTLDFQVLSQYPTITVSLQGGVTLTLNPSDYFLDVLSDRGTACKVFGISSIPGSEAIIGGTVLQKFNVIFDRVSNQIGFAPVSAGCNKNLALVPSAPFYRGNVNSSSGSAGLIAAIVIIVIIAVISVGITVYFKTRGRC